MRAHRTAVARHLAVLAIVLALAGMTMAQDPEFKLIRPSNTGIPGEQIDHSAIDSFGNVWVSARWPFWGEGGVASFDGTKWSTYSNVDTPMPSDLVMDTAFGPPGVNWYGTDAGLVRHVPATGQWDVYDRFNTPLPWDQISNVSVDASGTVWMRYFKGTFLTEGIASFDGTSWNVWSTDAIGFPINTDLVGPAIDANGHVWVGSTWGGQPNSGIARWDGSSWSIFNASTGQSNAGVFLVEVDDNGQLWVNWWLGLMRYDGTEWINMPDPPTPDSWSAFKARSTEDYWVATYSGALLNYDGTTWWSVTEGGQQIPWILSIDFDPNGDLWTGGLYSRLKHFEYATGTWTTYNESNTGLPSYFIEDFGVAPDGNMWIACSGAGAAEMEGTADAFQDATWRCFNADNEGFEPWAWDFGQPWGNDSANSVVSDGLGGMWVSSSGIGRWNDVEWELYVTQNSDIWTNFGDAILERDSNGDLWIGYDLYGIDRFDGTNFVHFDTTNGLPGNFVEDVAADALGNVYIATNGGVGHWDGTTMQTIALPAVLPFSAESVAIAPDGDLWVGTAGGIAHRDGAGWTVYDKANSALPANWINDILIGDDGTVWVGSFDAGTFPYPGGVSRFDGVEWTTWTTANSPLPHNQVEKLEFDLDGNVWVACASEAIAVLMVGGQTTVCQTDLGFGGPGNATLSMCGTDLSSGGSATLKLVNAAPNSTAWLIASTGNNPQPFKGGTLVPLPILLAAGLPTDAQGAVTLPGIAGGGGPATLFVQFAIQDAGQPLGYALSNALQVELLP